jgi:predicted TIM-barrel fold metal-dependent hydrolase
MTELKLPPLNGNPRCECPPPDFPESRRLSGALIRSKAALDCAISFYGVGHLLFASDAPFDPEGGPMHIRETIRAIDALDLSRADREAIYFKNACKLLGIK